MQVVQDVRYALRQFLKAPAFTATAMITLSLGIGATTAIFSLVHAVLLKSLPVVKPGQLYRVGDKENCCINGGMQDDWSIFSYEQYRIFREHTPGFEELAAFQAGRSLVGVRRSGSHQPSASYRAEFVSGNYFSTFGIPAYLGRTPTPKDDSKGAPAVAMMNFVTWREKFGEDRSVVGSNFIINGQPVTVVGIAPPGFFGDRVESNPPAFWIPLSNEPRITGVYSVLESPQLDWLDLIGRVRPGANVAGMEAEMQVELRQFLLSPVSKVEERDKPLVAKQMLHFSHGGNGVREMREEYQDGLHLLMWISAFVLLIACANLANLMIVRATARRQQSSIRSALGATRSILVRQALAESAVLGLLGGLLGIGIASAGTKMILHLAFPKEYVPIHAAPSLPVLGFALAVSLLTGLLFGVAPAWVMAKANPVEALRGANRSTGRNSGWGQRSLVVFQAALSLVLLLCAAGLLTESLTNMRHQHFGFVTNNRYILHMDPQMAGYKQEQLAALYRELHENLSAIPGVKQVSFSLYSPMEGDNWGEGVFIAGQPPPPPGTPDHGASWVRVSPGYFDTIGTRIVAGRATNAEDTPQTRTVAVVNRIFAKKYLPGAHAIGQHFSNDLKHPGAFEIVGVTENTRYRGTTETLPPMYFLAQGQSAHIDEDGYPQFEARSEYLNAIEIETFAPMPNLESQARRRLSQVNPDLAVIDFHSFADQVNTNFTQQEMIVKLTSFFGLLALVLASVGLYGVTAYSVERRTSEIGIRMAGGANRVSVVRLVLHGAFWQVAVGLLFGVPVTILAGRAMSSQLFGVKPYDPKILLLTSAALGMAACVAAVIPAFRAASVEPIRALRTE